MKHITTFFFLALMQAGCSDNKANSDTAKSSIESTATSKDAKEGNGDGIVGEWDLVGRVTDQNDNKQLDEAERQQAVTSVKDYMKFNRDGSAEYTVAQMQGTYKLLDDANTRRKYLHIYDKVNNESNGYRGYIISVSKDELILMHTSGGESFGIWKRL